MPNQKPMKVKLITVAFKLFADFGYHATSIQDIANEAEITKASIYHYFDSKEEILIAALQFAIANWEIEDLDECNQYVNFIIKMRFEMSDNTTLMADHLWPMVWEITNMMILKEKKVPNWAIGIIRGEQIL